MSNKPPKKGDLNKSWIRPRRDGKRDIAPEYHLIIAEGTKTEPNYFNGLKAQIDAKFPGRISLKVEGTGKNTKGLLKYAQQFVQEHAKKSVNEFKHIWLVFDKDDFPADHFNDTCFECENISTESTTYHALWSNQCIEYWFLLHFMYLDVPLGREAYFPKLSNYLVKKYKKNQSDIYEQLLPFLPTAIENAKKRLNAYDKINPSECDPCTKVYEIFDLLKNYL